MEHVIARNISTWNIPIALAINHNPVNRFRSTGDTGEESSNHTRNVYLKMDSTKLLDVDPKSKLVPKQFDSMNRDLWAQALRMPEAERVPTYLRLCNQLGRNPFRHVHNATDNTRITFEMRRIRRFLVKYIDQTWGVLTPTLNGRTPPITMRVTRTKLGFELHAKLTMLNVDFKALQKQVTSLMFFQYTGPYKVGKWDWYRKFPGYPLEIGVSSGNNAETFVWYTIRLNYVPYVNELLDPDPTKAFAEFVVRRLWLPIVYSQRMYSTRAKF